MIDSKRRLYLHEKGTNYKIPKANCLTGTVNCFTEECAHIKAKRNILTKLDYRPSTPIMTAAIFRANTTLINPKLEQSNPYIN